MDALVIGGTGPTGPFVVNGLLDRGYEVTIMHSGAHEAEFARPVEDLHGDPYFAETLHETLGNRSFDLVVAQYGRLRVIAEFMIGRTGRLIGVGTAHLRGWARDPRWGPLGRPLLTDEESGPPAPDEGGLGPRMWAARERLLELHREGYYNATYIGHPETYGPRQHSPGDWCVIKRVLDRRKQFIIADGGLKIHQRAYGENCAQSILLSIDKPKEAAGQCFTVGEQPLYTERQRIELICKAMNHEMELVDIPYALAKSCHYMWHGPGSNAVDDSKIRRILGYKEIVPPGEAQIMTVQWILENSPILSKEWEEQMEDTFDYAAEDELIACWKEAYKTLSSVEFKTKPPAHAYRHPRTPGEPWFRPESTKSFAKEWHKLEYY